MKQLQAKFPSIFSLQSSERITGCFPLWTAASDRVLQEVANCNYCAEHTYRVVVITSAAGLEKRASLCESHYEAAARMFPELDIP